METINDMLPSVGALTLGYLTYRGIKFLVSKIKTNPLKTYIRKIVLDYLNELQKD
jgi:hypothetical protein